MLAHAEIHLGWLNVVAWQSATAGIGFLTSSLIQGVASLNYPNYVAKRWHQTLIFWACVLVAIFINTVISRLLPKIEGIVLVLHVLGFFAILIPLLSMAPAKVNASDVFTEFYNGGGWPTTGLSFMLGFTAQCWNFLGMSIFLSYISFLLFHIPK
jgi:hypothetical protein